MKLLSEKRRQPLVSVCIITYNRNKDVLDCLNSIYSSTYKNIEVLLFDNHSRKRLTQKVLSKYQRLKYFYNDKNIGGAGGRSFCEKKAMGVYLMMLDDDTIIDEKLLEELVKTMEADPKIGMTGPKIFYYDRNKTNILLGGLGQISMLTTLCTDATYRKNDTGQFDRQTNIDYAQDGFMVRKEVANLVGGHDASLFMTYMETDYFMRVQKKGYKTVFVPSAKLWHKVHLLPKKSSILRDILGLNHSKRIYYNMRNRSVFVKRYYSWIAKLLYILFFVHTFFVFYFIQFIIYRAPKEYFHNLIRGYSDGLLIFFNIWKL